MGMTTEPIVTVAVDPSDNVVYIWKVGSTLTYYDVDGAVWGGDTGTLTEHSCAVSGSGLTEVATSDAGDISFTGDGTSGSPITGTLQTNSVGQPEIANLAVFAAAIDSDAVGLRALDSSSMVVTAVEATVAAFGSAAAANVNGNFAVLTAIDGANVAGLYQSVSGSWLLRIASDTGGGGGGITSVTYDNGTGDINFSGLGTGASPLSGVLDGVSISDLDAATADLDMGSFKISSTADPTNSNHLTRRSYVDNADGIIANDVSNNLIAIGNNATAIGNNTGAINAIDENKYAGTFTSVGGLPTAAAGNSGFFAIVSDAAGDANKGIYTSDGSSWTKVLSPGSGSGGGSSRALHIFSQGATHSNAGTPTQFISGTCPTLDAGDYLVTVTFLFRCGNASQSTVSEFNWDGGGATEIQRTEHKDNTATQRLGFSWRSVFTVSQDDTPTISVLGGSSGSAISQYFDGVVSVELVS